MHFDDNTIVIINIKSIPKKKKKKLSVIKFLSPKVQFSSWAPSAEVHHQKTFGDEFVMKHFLTK